MRKIRPAFGASGCGGIPVQHPAGNGAKAGELTTIWQLLLSTGWTIGDPTNYALKRFPKVT